LLVLTIHARGGGRPVAVGAVKARFLGLVGVTLGVPGGDERGVPAGVPGVGVLGCDLVCLRALAGVLAAVAGGEGDAEPLLRDARIGCPNLARRAYVSGYLVC
jgi:hypothetical protein